MKKNKGQSLIDVVFSVAIVILVLTGVVILIVSTAKIKRVTFERQKAVELSQLLIENKVLEIKKDLRGFWEVFQQNKTDQEWTSSGDFTGYLYDVTYDSCDNQRCNVIFTVKWGDSQTLSVERLFLRQGT